MLMSEETNFSSLEELISFIEKEVKRRYEDMVKNCKGKVNQESPFT